MDEFDLIHNLIFALTYHKLCMLQLAVHVALEPAVQVDACKLLIDFVITEEWSTRGLQLTVISCFLERHVPTYDS